MTKTPSELAALLEQVKRLLQDLAARGVKQSDAVFRAKSMLRNFPNDTELEEMKRVSNVR